MRDGGTSTPPVAAICLYWQSARETNVSSRHSGPLVRPDSRTFGGQTKDVVMSMLLPEVNPLALQIASAAATQSGAPFGAFGHFS